MNRRSFLKQIGIGSATLALGQYNRAFGAAGKSPSPDHPNILWIVSEDNNPLLGCYGDEFATTPNLDKFATEAILYENAFANAPVCAPARCTIITGMYPPALGTQHMRSNYKTPSFVKFFPTYLKNAGYYCSNNSKKDYNTSSWPKKMWDESSNKAHYKNRAPGQHFFSIFNLGESHEGQIHPDVTSTKHDPAKVTLPPYHPDTPELRQKWAQYYDQIQKMDAHVGKLLKELEDNNLAENTIVFYYSDHGGVLTRSKRYLYDSGTRVPFIVRFGKKYQHLAPAKPGTKTDRMVSFIDLAPTVLSLANIKVPDYMQGHAFLGKQKTTDPQYAYLFRDRMDERYDMMRAIRDKKFKYIRNYMPHRIYGQRLNYLWRQSSTRSWEQAYKDSKCDKIQSIFWNTKPTEELYEIKTDPHEVNNLAYNPKYKSTLLRMREEVKRWIRQIRDTGFIPEVMLMQMTKDKTAYDLVHDPAFPLEKIIETAEIATERDPSKLPTIIENLSNPDPTIRYWASIGCIVLADHTSVAYEKLHKNLNDPSPNVRFASAEALCKMGKPKDAVKTLIEALDNQSNMTVVAALDVLEAIGDDAKPAAKKIRELAKKSKNIKQLRYIHDASNDTTTKFK